jgi:predicted AlkP superfamily phosphohydrolase/phosphomutase/Flp pilus assembly protein TadD
MSRRALAVLLLVALVGCRSRSSPGRIVVLGIDGLDPETVDLLMSEGSLPSFARLRQEGAYARLISAKPLLSPIIWTTIATGKPPAEHGIGHFVALNEKTGEELPVTSQMRRTRAIWNILSAAGRKVGVVGWWATWPAEVVNGDVVSDHACYHFLRSDPAKAEPDSGAITYPPDLLREIAPMIRRPGDLKAEELAPFVNVDASELARPFSFVDPSSHFKWALATADSYARIGLHLWERERPDLLLVYIEGVDSTSHLFGHLFRAHGLAGELAEQQRRYGNAVEEMYHYADRLVGRYLNALGAGDTLVVLSDHGFQLGVLPDDPTATHDLRRVSERYHRLEGVLYLYGRGVRPRSRIDRPTLLDVTPTLLALSGLPPARDMPGRILTEALDLPPSPAPLAPVATYEPPLEAARQEGTADANIDPAIVERLRSLGYLGVRSPAGDRNMAAMSFEAGRPEEAARAYEELLRESPDDGELHASLGGALGRLGRFDEALEHLDTAIRLAPLSVAAYHNRGAVYERQGKRDAALAEYRTALRYDPQYVPSREALRRLTGAAETGHVGTVEERRAVALAQQASSAARRGDYPAAMEALDQAERLAPHLTLLYQYRANVAFLMGDRARAIAALRQALAREPDNALFQANLRRLEAGVPR